MRYFVLSVSLLVACDPGVELAAPGTVCAEAQDHFLECGVALGILSGSTCSGPGRLVAECVVERAGSCERLASITYDACLAEAAERAGEAADGPGFDPVNLFNRNRDGEGDDS